MDEEEFLAALRRDPRAALELGCRIAALDDVDQRRHAEVAFEIARDGDPTTVWHAATAYALQIDGRAARWMAEGAASLSDPDGIVVDRQTLPIVIEEYDEDRWVASYQDWRIAVRCDTPERAVAALHAATHRLLYVTDDGGVAADDTEPGSRFTPNFVAVDEDGPDAPLVWLDCESVVIPLMARAVIEIVIEELRAAGITRAELSTPRTEPTFTRWGSGR